MELLNKNEDSKEQENSEFYADGWDAIDEEAKRIYPGQDNPKHYAALIKWRLGGPDPLDGISVYDGGDYWHFVTYGLSELYEKESENKEWSGYGMEFTFKLKKDNYVDEEQEISVFVEYYSKLHELLLKMVKYLIHLNIYIQDKQKVLIQDKFQI
jgi:hypothetical protein